MHTAGISGEPSRLEPLYSRRIVRFLAPWILLTPLLVALHELVPWVEQWHNEPDPVHGTRNGEAFRAFLEEEMRGLGLSELRSWGLGPAELAASGLDLVRLGPRPRAADEAQAVLVRETKVLEFEEEEAEA